MKLLQCLKQFSLSLDKLNEEVDTHIFKDHEVVPTSLLDKDIPPSDICKCSEPILRANCRFSKYDDNGKKQRVDK